MNDLKGTTTLVDLTLSLKDLKVIPSYVAFNISKGKICKHVVCEEVTLKADSWTLSEKKKSTNNPSLINEKEQETLCCSFYYVYLQQKTLLNANTHHISLSIRIWFFSRKCEY